MSLDFQRPTGKPASESDKLSMAELGGEEEMMEEGEEMEEESPLFTEIEAMEMLEKLGYSIAPPEGAEGVGEEDDMDEFVREEPSVPIVGSN